MIKFKGCQKGYMFYVTVDSYSEDVSYLYREIDLTLEDGKWKMKFSLCVPGEKTNFMRFIEQLSSSYHVYTVQLLDDTGSNFNHYIDIRGKLKANMCLDYSNRDNLIITCEVV